MKWNWDGIEFVVLIVGCVLYYGWKRYLQHKEIMAGKVLPVVEEKED